MEYNQRIFYDAHIKQDEYKPLAQPEANYITPEELKNVL
jgi:hypothetical protein